MFFLSGFYLIRLGIWHRQLKTGSISLSGCWVCSSSDLAWWVEVQFGVCCFFGLHLHIHDSVSAPFVELLLEGCFFVLVNPCYPSYVKLIWRLLANSCLIRGIFLLPLVSACWIIGEFLLSLVSYFIWGVLKGWKPLTSQFILDKLKKETYKNYEWPCG